MDGNIVIPAGIKIGHYTDESAKTGCTVLVFEDGATCSVDVRGEHQVQEKPIYSNRAIL